MLFHFSVAKLVGWNIYNTRDLVTKTTDTHQ